MSVTNANPFTLAFRYGFVDGAKRTFNKQLLKNLSLCGIPLTTGCNPFKHEGDDRDSWNTEYHSGYDSACDMPPDPTT